MPDHFPVALSRSRRTSEPDVFARAVAGADCECTPFPSLPFAATLRQLQLSDMLLIQHVSVGPHISRAALSSNLQLLLVPLQQCGTPPHVNGAPVRLNEALLVPGGIEFRCHSPAPHERAAIGVPPALLEMWAELSGLPVKVRGAACVLALPPGPARRLAAALEQLYAGGRTSCVLGRLAAADVETAVRQSLEQALENWIRAIDGLACESGISSARARPFAEDWVARLQRALILRAATGSTGAFERALQALLDLAKDEPTPTES